MNVPAKLASFFLVLALIFALGAGMGALVGPFDDQRRPAHTGHSG